MNSTTPQPSFTPPHLPQAVGRRAPAVVSGEKFRILVIEDDLNIARLIMANLSKLGFECRTASDGRSAMQSFVATNPHLILLDLGLPGLDGGEVCARIRISSTIPIIIVTAQDEANQQVQLLKAGADDYIIKPFDINVLVTRVVTHLRRAYRYDVEASAADPASKVPGGWATCDSCQYIGPSTRFEGTDAQGRRVMTCPNCRSINQVAFEVGALR